MTVRSISASLDRRFSLCGAQRPVHIATNTHTRRPNPKEKKSFSIPQIERRSPNLKIGKSKKEISKKNCFIFFLSKRKSRAQDENRCPPTSVGEVRSLAFRVCTYALPHCYHQLAHAQSRPRQRGAVDIPIQRLHRNVSLSERRIYGVQRCK